MATVVVKVLIDHFTYLLLPVRQYWTYGKRSDVDVISGVVSEAGDVRLVGRQVRSYVGQ